MKNWSAGAKLVALSAVGVLLGVGLCSAAPNFLEQDSWQASSGMVLFWGSVLGLILGVVVVLIQGVRKDD